MRGEEVSIDLLSVEMTQNTPHLTFFLQLDGGIMVKKWANDTKPPHPPPHEFDRLGGGRGGRLAPLVQPQRMEPC